MRRPPSIFMDRTDLGEGLALGDKLADAELCHAFPREVAVESEKLPGIVSRMSQNNDGPVVERSVVVGNRVHRAIQRRTNVAASFQEKIYSQMHSAALVNRAVAFLEQWRCIEEARFIIPADTYGSVGELQLAPHGRCQSRRFRALWICSQECAGDAQIEYQTRRGSQIQVHNGRRALSISRQRLRPMWSFRHRRQTTSLPKRVVRKARVDLGKVGERFPRGGFRDNDIRIVRHQRLALGRVHDAHRKADADQRKQYRQLSFLERKHVVKSPHQRRRRREWLALAEEAISRCDGRFGNHKPVVQVAEINDADCFARWRARIVDQNVVVIRIAVDRASP